MSAPSSTAPCLLQRERLNGQDVVRMALTAGDSATIALHGGQLISWCTADGQERLFLSPDAVWDGHAAIRGGVPVCFPQFNQRGPLVKHGFARHLPWQCEGVSDVCEGAQATFVLRDDEHTRAVWPHAFEARLMVLLGHASLRVTLELRNTGAAPWSFTGALHTYLRVPDITQAHLDGLDGLACWDAVRDVHGVQQGAVAFDGEVDRVFAAATERLRLRDGQGADIVTVEHSASWDNVVVWNPGAALCAQLRDMPPQGWREMLCIEAASIDRPVVVPPGQCWSGWQQLTA